MTPKLTTLLSYAERGWTAFPCWWLVPSGSGNGGPHICACPRGAECDNKPGKHPHTAHGFYDATKSEAKIERWCRTFPDANWAIRTGSTQDGGSGLVIIDLDHHDGRADGRHAWEQLLAQHPEAKADTLQVRTGGGGTHLYFKYPDGEDIKTKVGMWPGIDMMANLGYVLVPPSHTVIDYVFENDNEILDLPEFIIEKYKSVLVIPSLVPTLKRKYDEPDTPENHARNIVMATSALAALKRDRVEDYELWLKVGISLYSLGDDGLSLWDSWSRQSTENYEPGKCAQKWLTFSPATQRDNAITLGSLVHWGEEDGQRPFIRPAPKHVKPSHYGKALEALGFHFSLNEMNDMVYVNNVRMDDIIMAKIMTELREWDYKQKEVAVDKMLAMGAEHKFHPIRDYLESLEWDGEDHIGKLCSYFQDQHNVFHIIFPAWLRGAVIRVMTDVGKHHPMLVLDGRQGKGKSYFARWLGSALPSFFLENEINAGDKDFKIMLCSKWVWEVHELGSTFRRADLEALKGFISSQVVTVRKPYGHEEIVKPATASFIGTINDVGGFLADPTGNRRYRVSTLTNIDWAYSKEVDVNQMWAQAVQQVRDGGLNELPLEEENTVTEITSKYEIEDTLSLDIVQMFTVDPNDKEHRMSILQMIQIMRERNVFMEGSSGQIINRVANFLTRAGCEKTTIRINGQQMRMWSGVTVKQQSAVFDMFAQKETG